MEEKIVRWWVIIFHEVDSCEYHLKVLNDELKKQFAIYKNRKLEIDNCSSFDEYSELKRANKKYIIDYHEISEYDFKNYHYSLILIYLTKKDEMPISYYVSISVEKNLKDHISLLSLRYEDLEKAKSMYFKYKEVFKKNNDVLILKMLEKDMKNNEWDLY